MRGFEENPLENDPKVEFVSFCSPKTTSLSLVLVLRISNQRVVVEKMTGSARFNHKIGFSKCERVFEN